MPLHNFETTAPPFSASPLAFRVFQVAEKLLGRTSEAEFGFFRSLYCRAEAVLILPIPPPFLAVTTGWRHLLRPAGTALLCFPGHTGPSGFPVPPKKDWPSRCGPSKKVALPIDIVSSQPRQALAVPLSASLLRRLTCVDSELYNGCQLAGGALVAALRCGASICAPLRKHPCPRWKGRLTRRRSSSPPRSMT